MGLHATLAQSSVLATILGLTFLSLPVLICARISIVNKIIKYTKGHNTQHKHALAPLFVYQPRIYVVKCHKVALPELGLTVTLLDKRSMCSMML